ncbi:hypothetical protein [Nocardia huaxiensis]|uniref:Integral membrane protein n=1 Tax=Nocardia huaxiensis TaxID=2755382 RepID=A0A7D6ZBT3_9NOCA|nr:hypothetical protein [Nocardia huaxiensis]QLY29878.1 hypothetical protein H0264_32470 [Nocardia huaxiensis]UFS96534.1 hypothetical protein LPY97_00900 [Nocardia huaxiensis]
MTAMTSTPAARRILGMTPLRLAYEFDGIATMVSGVAITALAGVLDSPLGLDTWVLLATGIFFMVYAAGVLVVATRREIPRRAAAVIAGLNAFWTVDSLVTLAAGWLEPTTLGAVGIILIAGFTAVMSAAQFVLLRAAR